LSTQDNVHKKKEDPPLLLFSLSCSPPRLALFCVLMRTPGRPASGFELAIMSRVKAAIPEPRREGEGMSKNRWDDVGEVPFGEPRELPNEPGQEMVVFG
jgi:hypothetical protein